MPHRGTSRRARVTGLAAVLFGFGAAGAAYAEQSVSEDVLAEARASYIFVLRDDIPTPDLPTRAKALVAEHGGELRFHYRHALKGFSATLAPAAAARLGTHPAIRYHEPNGVAFALGAPTVTHPGGVTATARPGETIEPPQQAPYGVTRVGGPRDGSGRHAWVIDTGIDLDHPDLTVGPGINFARGKNTPDDANGHGTHVAGTIGARDNAIGVAGVAANATVHPVRVLDANGSGTVDAVIAGVDYVAAQGRAGDVANLSLGASGHFQSLHDAVLNTANLGIRFAIAAGNSSADASLSEPAHVEHENVYTVSAIDSLDVFAYFSNFGNPPVDYAAPGVGVLSTQAGGGVVSYSGTSMAAPHVAGVLLFAPPLAGGLALGDPDGIPDPIAHY